MDASEIGVVFDCDGTLLDSMGVWHGLQNELAERAGGTLTAEDVAALAPMSIPECGAFFHERFGLGESDREVVGMIDEYMLDFYRHRAEPRPGALEFVQGLAQAGAHLTVASSSPKPYLMAGIERCGFAPYLERVLSVEDVHSTKREPDVWDRAREIMGTSKQLTWGVEDSAYAIGTLAGAGYRTATTPARGMPCRLPRSTRSAASRTSRSRNSSPGTSSRSSSARRTSRGNEGIGDSRCLSSPSFQCLLSLVVRLLVRNGPSGRACPLIRLGSQ